MKILLNETEPLHLEPDFELNIQLTNPLLTDQGSMSLPLKLPKTSENLRKLGFPNRYDRRYKLQKKTPVLVEHGIMRKQAVLEIISSQGVEGIESVLLLDEAKMYTKMQEINMASAFKIVREAKDISIPGITISDPIEKLIKYMELVMLGQITDDFLLFPVSTDFYEVTVNAGRDKEVQLEVHNCLNQQCSRMGRGVFEEITDNDLEGKKYFKLRGREAFFVKDSSDEYEVPKGYGITPFLKESFALRQIFKYFGYELSTSIFDTDPDLSREVLINNTADTLVRGTIDYTQLVPTCTIHAYLETVRARFGCEFFVSEDHKVVVPVFWKDILKSNPTKDYTDKVVDEPIVEYETPKQVKLCYKRGLDFSEMSADTIEKFEQVHGNIIEYLKDYPDGRGGTIYQDGFYFFQNECAIYERYTYWEEKDQKYYQSWRYVMRAMFDYYEEGEDIEYEEPSHDLEYTPYIQAKVEHTHANSSGAIGYYSLRLLHIGSRRHMNTTMQITTTDENGATETTEKQEDTGSCPIMTAFWHVNDIVTDYKSPMGTMHRYDTYGNIVGNIDLTFGGEYGLYEHFWKEYNEVLKHSFLKLTFNLHLTELDIINFRMDELITINGQLLLPEQLEYTINKNMILANKVDFRTVRLYEDPPD